jgi:phosphoglucosamine mutase
VLAVLAEERRPASEAAHIFEPAPQILENVRFKNGSPLSDPKIACKIKLAEARLDNGRLLVRKSGTEPVIRIMGEGENEKLVREVVREVAAFIREAGA